MIDFNQLPRFKPYQFQLAGLIPEWSRAYGVSEEAIERQIQIAHAWAKSNPRRAPRKDPVRFLFNWMRKAKEFGNLVERPRSALYKEGMPQNEVMTGEDFAKMREAIRFKPISTK